MKKRISGVKFSVFSVTIMDENGNEILLTTKVCNGVCHFVTALLTFFLFSFSWAWEGLAAFCLLAVECIICYAVLNALLYAVLSLYLKVQKKRIMEE